MNVLVIGEGGREHAIIWKIAQSPKVKKIFCVPGNAGIAELAECVHIDTTDNDALVEFALNNKIDLTVVGPEVALANGIVDAFENAWLRIFGPSKKAAEIEASKIFSKELMKKYNIPTAEFGIFSNANDAKKYIEANEKYPIVIKADGLAAGKGVIIAQTKEEAVATIDEMMLNEKFGNAGKNIVIEEFLSGIEISILAFTDGKTIVPMESAKDYKKIGENDLGLNTGGMGAISPNPIYTDEDAEYCYNNIFLPSIKAMKSEGRKFKGVLYIGMIKTEKGIFVIEYNCRFGDPETQVIMPRLETDITDIFNAVIDEKLAEIDIKWNKKKILTTVLASGGYPEEYRKGYEIINLDKTEDAVVFHAGTKLLDGKAVTNGGRVLNVTAIADTFEEAKSKSLKNCDIIDFKDKYYRKDIGK